MLRGHEKEPGGFYQICDFCNTHDLEFVAGQFVNCCRNSTKYIQTDQNAITPGSGQDLSPGQIAIGALAPETPSSSFGDKDFSIRKGTSFTKHGVVWQPHKMYPYNFPDGCNVILPYT